MSEPVEPPIGFDDFRRVDIRVGTIVEAVLFPEARKPSIKLFLADERWIDTLLNMREGGLFANVTEIWAFAVSEDCFMIYPPRKGKA